MEPTEGFSIGKRLMQTPMLTIVANVVQQGSIYTAFCQNIRQHVSSIHPMHPTDYPLSSHIPHRDEM